MKRGVSGPNAALGRDYFEVAFRDSEAGRARALVDLLAERNVAVTQGAAPSLLRKERQLNDLTASLAARLREYGSERNRNLIRINETSRALAEKEQELEEVQICLRRSRYGALRYPTPVSVEELQQRLPARTALVAYHTTQTQLVAWVITRHSVACHTTPVGIGELQRQVDAFRRPLEEARAGRDVFVSPSQRLAGTWLYSRLLAPIHHALQNARRLIVVPHGPLFYLPFAALEVPGDRQLPRGEPRASNRRPHYLIDDCSVVTVPSATAWTDIRAQRAKERASHGALGSVLTFAPFAGRDRRPAVTPGGPASASASREDAGPGTERPTVGGLRAYYREMGIGFETLPSTFDEAVSIERHIPQHRTYLAYQATERRAKIESGGFSVIHFSTHGILDDRNPQYSGVALAESIENSAAPSLLTVRPEMEDGFLQTQEVFNLELHADLVVLSGCETALGNRKPIDQQTTAEGFVGLTRGFLYAGAPTVVVSVWKVHDRTTAELMDAFYQSLTYQAHRQAGSIDKAEALRQAQLRLLDDQYHSDPFYWAAFLVVGDWE